MNGFLLIDKPSGRSSASCVYSLRKILKIKKIGHCGTLDPLATGVRFAEVSMDLTLLSQEARER